MKFLIIVLLLLLDLFLLVLYGASGHKIKTTDIETIKYFFMIFFNFFAILVLIFDKKLSKKITLFMCFLLQVEFIYMMFYFLKAASFYNKIIFMIIFLILIIVVFFYQKSVIHKVQK